MDLAIQLTLPLVSVTTTWLVAQRRISGVVISLASQPLWIVTACIHRQWGVVVTALLNSGSLAWGIRSWVRERRAVGSTPSSRSEAVPVDVRCAAAGIKEAS